MSLLVLNSTAYAYYTPPTKDADAEEDEEDQSKSCQENVDNGTAPCAMITRPKTEFLPIALNSPPDIHGGGIKRGRVDRLLTAVLGSSDGPPARDSVPASATLLRSRGSRHGIRRCVRVRMDTRTTRYVRIWSVALDRHRRVLCAITFLFELRAKPRGGGIESFRLIEGDQGHATSTPRARSTRTKKPSPRALDAAAD